MVYRPPPTSWGPRCSPSGGGEEGREEGSGEGREEGEEGREKREGEGPSFFRAGFLVVAGALTTYYVSTTYELRKKHYFKILCACGGHLERPLLRSDSENPFRFRVSGFLEALVLVLGF